MDLRLADAFLYSESPANAGGRLGEMPGGPG